MSVRSKIEAFEARHSGEGSDSINKNEASTKKRFHYPGKQSKEQSRTNTSIPGVTNRAVKKQGLTDIETDLQQVWSVRKNIHHQGGTGKQASSYHPAASLPSVQNTGHYSRHGAIAAQQTHGTCVQPKTKDLTGNALIQNDDDDFSFETKYSTPQEQNSKDTPWNVKKSTAYSYNTHEAAAKRPVSSPHATNGGTTTPKAKRKAYVGEADVIRPTAELHPHSKKNQQDRVSYAKRMASGYLQSVGIGEFTPKSETHRVSKHSSTGPIHTTSNTRRHTGKTTRWKKSSGDDDFNFD